MSGFWSIFGLFGRFWSVSGPRGTVWPENSGGHATIPIRIDPHGPDASTIYEIFRIQHFENLEFENIYLKSEN